MDGLRFDGLTKSLACVFDRRQGLRLTVAGIALGLGSDDAAAACGGPGARCQNGGACCSRVCLRKRKRKGKKRKPGKCDCSFPRELCNSADNCCLAASTCGDNGCDSDDVCCQGHHAECFDDCECCGDFFCSFFDDTCVDCGQPLDPCVTIEDCCAGIDTCGDNGCDDYDACCLGEGGSCVGACDCCLDFACDERAGNTCQDCALPQDACTADDDCCLLDSTCGDNGCDDVDTCCQGAGGLCFDDCDCCGEFVCNGETCVPFRQAGVAAESRGAGKSRGGQSANWRRTSRAARGRAGILARKGWREG